MYNHHVLVYGAVLSKDHNSPFIGNLYAIYVRDREYNILPLKEVQRYIYEFIAFAKDHDDLLFEITSIGFQFNSERKQIISWFMDAPDNCLFAKTWLKP